MALTTVHQFKQCIMKQLGLKAMLLFGLALLLSASDGFAQGRGNNKDNGNSGRGNSGNNGNPGRGNSGKNDKKEKEGRGVPLDGGTTLLLAAGAAYGLKRLNDSRHVKA
ncbi:PID-CTERM protein-sorting domain-containing protein [Hymenobacter sp. HDW8]|uniref:PID-CTERM protein-sorting domain-containing protein n=1 Tax=Hymenobacter sp. HDW8 TaxID=2714932 RepID=UPI00140A78CC|nr:hypothetical protein [Hymenobacter sp. HDW8]QIL75322.1 hypothetical protein G7064_05260 [Hymenobacter sp. HDW8]